MCINLLKKEIVFGNGAIQWTNCHSEQSSKFILFACRARWLCGQTVAHLWIPASRADRPMRQGQAGG